MSISDAYKVVTTGQILDGFSAEDVRQHLISVFGLKPGQAERFFEQPRVVKKDVSWASADKICSQLAKLGVSAKIQSPEPPAESRPPEPVPALHEEPALELVQEEPAAPAQPESPPQVDPAAAPMQPESPAQAIPAAAAMPAADAVSTDDGTVVVSSNGAAEKGSLSPAAIGAALVAALIGAFIWRFVAVTFEYEFGLIAWGIGGAVGIAAAGAGSRGMQAGVVCAVLAFGSIVLGKYWAYSAFVDQFQEAVSGAMEYEGDMRDYYEEELEDARLLVRGTGGDVFTRRFMVERGYTYETDAARVSKEELADFRDYIEPNLREMAANPPSFEEWQERSAESLGEISPWAMMRENFGLLDILFAFLGIGTAFRLASQSD